jgi:hypothetical protein
MVHKFTEVFTQYITIFIDIEECLITNNDSDGDGDDDAPKYKTSFNIFENMDCPIEIVTKKFIEKFLDNITFHYYYETFKEVFETYFNESDFNVIQHYLCRAELFYFTEKYGEYTEMLEYEKDFYIRELILYSSEKFVEKHIIVMNNILEKFITPTYCLK